jgi:hypothetical protein
VNYRNSRLVGEDRGIASGPVPGDRAPDCRGLRRESVSHPVRLFELLAAPHHTLLLYADQAAQLPALAEARKLVNAVTPERIRTYLIVAGTLAGDNDTSAPVIVDADNQFREAYGATGGSGYLVRPDGHLSFRSASITAEGLRRHLSRVFATTSPAST